jgi:hypothetical protein
VPTEKSLSNRKGINSINTSSVGKMKMRGMMNNVHAIKLNGRGNSINLRGKDLPPTTLNSSKDAKLIEKTSYNGDGDRDITDTIATE